jgi:hypothetical protein
MDKLTDLKIKHLKPQGKPYKEKFVAEGFTPSEKQKNKGRGGL